MKKMILFFIVAIGILATVDLQAKATQKGETAHPVFKKTYTFE